MSIHIRTKTYNNKDGSIREYLYLIESYWDSDSRSTKQRNLCCIGRTDDEKISQIAENIITGIMKYTNRHKFLNISDENNSFKTKSFGEIAVIRKLWKETGFENILNEYLKKTRIQIPLTETIFAMVCNRLMSPGSDRSICDWKGTVYEPLWESYDLHHFYRALDFLIEHKENLEIDMFESVKNLFNSKVDIVMFDTTSVSYWGEGSHASGLLRHGYAKNKRFDLKQAVIGIIMDQDGMPLGHEVWEGNKSDKPAFKEIIEKVKTKFTIGKVILVADRGMVSEENLAYLEESNHEYILGVKMRQLSECRRNYLLENEGFEHMEGTSLEVKEAGEYELWYRERVHHGSIPTEEEIKEYKQNKKSNRRWVVCLNKAMEKLDKVKREYFREILEGKIEYSAAKEWIIKNGYKKYVNIEEMRISLNEERLIEDELYDGKWVMISNSKLPAFTLVKSYKELAKIERHFRDLKTELEVGPIYHYTEPRIRGHIFICFIALQLKVALTKKLKQIDEELSYSEVMRDVSKMTVTLINTNEQEIIIRSDVEGKAHLAFKAVKAPIPNKILTQKMKSNNIP